MCFYFNYLIKVLNVVEGGNDLIVKGYLAIKISNVAKWREKYSEPQRIQFDSGNQWLKQISCHQ